MHTKLSLSVRIQMNRWILNFFKAEFSLQQIWFILKKLQGQPAVEGR